MQRKLAKTIFERLLNKYPNPKTSLVFSNDAELLVSSLLSVQCKDERVNKQTKILFKQYNTFDQFAKINKKILIKYIKSCGYYNSKAKYIIESSRIISEKYNNKLPKSINELTKLPGVGRKVANILLSERYKINEGIAIDTHNKRVSKRIGLSINTDPKKIERDLMKLYPKKDWNIVSLLLVEHGRNVCKASKPKCTECPIKQYCDYYRNISDQKV